MKYIKYVIIKKTLKMSMKGGTMYRGEKPKKRRCSKNYSV